MNFSLFDIVLLLVIFLLGLQFWTLRGIAERAQRYLAQYCENHQLQLISVARYRTRIALAQGKPVWQVLFVFEFSATGTECYQGTLNMLGNRASHIDVPPYRMH